MAKIFVLALLSTLLLGAIIGAHVAAARSKGQQVPDMENMDEGDGFFW